MPRRLTAFSLANILDYFSLTGLFDFLGLALSAHMMETNEENFSTIKYCAALCGCPRTAPSSGTLNCVFNAAFASMPSGRLGIENTKDCCSALHSIAISREMLSLQAVA